MVTTALALVAVTAADARGAWRSLYSCHVSEEEVRGNQARVDGLAWAGEALKAEWNYKLLAYEQHIALAAAALATLQL